MIFSSESGQRFLNPRHHTFFAQNFEQMIQARTVGVAGDGEARRVDERSHFYAEFGRSGFERGFNGSGIKD